MNLPAILSDPNALAAALGRTLTDVETGFVRDVAHWAPQVSAEFIQLMAKALAGAESLADYIGSDIFRSRITIGVESGKLVIDLSKREA